MAEVGVWGLGSGDFGARALPDCRNSVQNLGFWTHWFDTEQQDMRGLSRHHKIKRRLCECGFA